MTVTDPIADMLTRLRNAIAVKHDTVVVPDSRLKRAVAQVLASEGYIQRYELSEGKPFPMLRVYLKYDGGKDKLPVMRGAERVSRPGCRVYTKKEDIPWVRSGLGTTILSTSRGILTDREARRLGVGGEVLCKVW
jgi:small subunit ribosomal protein S8